MTSGGMTSQTGSGTYTKNTLSVVVSVSRHKVPDVLIKPCPILQ